MSKKSNKPKKEPILQTDLPPIPPKPVSSAEKPQSPPEIEDTFYEDELVNEELPDEDSDDTYSDDTPLPETDNARWELDEEPIIANLRKELKKRMNGRGVDAVLSWMRISLGKNVALSNLDIEEINRLMRNEMPRFNFELVQNMYDWGIPNTSARNAISRWVERSMYLQLKRAYNDGERKYRKDSYSYNESYNHDEVRNDEIGRGGFSFPFFGKRRQPRYETRDEYDPRF